MHYNRFEFGNRIRSLREAKGLTQVRLAMTLNVTSGFISNIECGKKSTSIEFLSALATFFNVSADYLMYGTSPAPPYDKRIDDALKTAIEEIKNARSLAKLNAK